MRRSLKWLYPGMHVKRWLGLLFIGILLLALGIALILTNIYRQAEFEGVVGVIAYYGTAQPIPRLWRGILLVVIGGVLLLIGFVGFNRTVLSAVKAPMDNLVDILYHRRQMGRGPKVVAIGGGTGLSTLLRGLKEHTTNLTAIVTVADDGGSSGRLRRGIGMLPPGDFRNCIVALSDVEPLMTRLFQYRFGEGSDLDGHSFGNLFIAALWQITGNFEEALREVSRVLAVRGQIIPSTLQDVTLWGELGDGRHVAGESQIGHSGQPIRRVYLKPDGVSAYPDAQRAILDAELIVVGPGSLYTSVLPNLLVDGISEALRLSHAPRVYVCNVATEDGETDNFKVADHVRVLDRHVGPGLFDYVLVNNNLKAAKGTAHPVRPDGESLEALGCRAVEADVVDATNPLRHDSQKLARSLIRLYDEHCRQGPIGNGRNGQQAKAKGSKPKVPVSTR